MHTLLITAYTYIPPPRQQSQSVNPTKTTALTPPKMNTICMSQHRDSHRRAQSSYSKLPFYPCIPPMLPDPGIERPLLPIGEPVFCHFSIVACNPRNEGLRAKHACAATLRNPGSDHAEQRRTADIKDHANLGTLWAWEHTERSS